MPERISRQTILAPAKINLCLYVGARRVDGYHPVFSLMEKVSLFDCLELEDSPAGGVELGGFRPEEGQSILEKAYSVFSERFGELEAGLRVELAKEIPVGAGLAGGSSDAAALLALLAERKGLVPPGGGAADLPALVEAAAAVGADVPFFLAPGPALVEGIGERVTFLDLPFEYGVVIINPGTALSTASVYARFDELSSAGDDGDLESRVAQVRGAVSSLASLEDLLPLLYNDLEPAAIEMEPKIADLKRRLLREGALASLMSGSGSSVFGLFAGESEAEAAAGRLRRDHPLAWAASPFRI